MLITCDEKTYLYFKFGSDFSKHLFLFEVLQLNDNRLFDTPVNLQSCNLADVANFLSVCLLRKQFWYGLKGGRHNIFKAANLPVNWLKIPKLVNITDFPLSSF